MNKYFKLNIILLLGLTCVIQSCNSNQDGTVNTNLDATTSSSATTNASEEKTQALTGTLDILVATRNSFTDLPRGTKLVFSHSFGSGNKVHLNGWVLVGNNFPGTTVALNNGAPSNIAFDENTYFSNVVLMPAEFNKIRDALTGDPNFQSVIFIPKRVNTNFIGYDLYPSVGGAFNSQGLAATAEANPSPPRTY